MSAVYSLAVVSFLESESDKGPTPVRKEEKKKKKKNQQRAKGKKI